MRERIRDIERLNHILDAIKVLLDNKDNHTLEEMASDPIVYRVTCKTMCLAIRDTTQRVAP